MYYNKHNIKNLGHLWEIMLDFNTPNFYAYSRPAMNGFWTPAFSNILIIIFWPTKGYVLRIMEQPNLYI